MFFFIFFFWVEGDLFRQFLKKTYLFFFLIFFGAGGVREPFFCEYLIIVFQFVFVVFMFFLLIFVFHMFFDVVFDVFVFFFSFL